MIKRKYVVVKDQGPIPELNFIAGPVGPTNINMESVIAMVQNGRQVYEKDPKNPKTEIELTLNNVTKDNIGSAPQAPVQPEQPAPEKPEPVQEPAPEKVEPEVKFEKVEEPVEVPPVTVPEEVPVQEEEVKVEKVEEPAQEEPASEEVPVQEEKKEEEDKAEEKKTQNKNQSKKNNNKGKNNKKN